MRDDGESSPKVRRPRVPDNKGDAGKVLRFGNFVLDYNREKLYKGELPVRLHHQPMAILMALVDRPGEIVTRQDLQQRIWPTGTYVDFEAALNTAVRSLRAVLGDTAVNARYIETLPRQGYRFIAPVRLRELSNFAGNSSESNPILESVPLITDSTVGVSVVGVKDNRAGSPVRNWFFKRRAMLVFGIGLVACIFVFWIAVRHFNATPVAEHSMTVVPLTSLPGDEMQPGFSPDGAQVVFRWRSPNFDQSALAIQTIGESTTRILTNGAAADSSPVWSPDGSKIAFIRGDGDVMVIPARGGAPRKLAETAGDHLSWVPSSNRLVIAVKNPMSHRFWADTIDVETGEHKLLLGQAANLNGYMPVIYSLTGKYLIYAAQGDSGADELILKSPGDAVAQKLLQLTPDLGLRGFGWAPDEKSVIYSTNSSGSFRLWRVGRDGRVSLLSSAGEESYFPSLWYRHGAGSAQQGRLAYEKRDLSTHLYEAVLKRTAPGRPISVRVADSPLFPSTRVDSSPSISPDGRETCFVSNRSGGLQLWCSRPGDPDPDVRVVTSFKGAMPGSPKWHPWRRLIVFDLLAGPDRNIWTLDLDTSTATQITSWHGNQVRPSWSRNGSWIYFGSSHSGSQQIWKVRYPAESARTAAPVQVTRDGGFEAAESPDGKMLFFSGADSGVLWSIPVTGGIAKQVLTDPVRDGWWSVGANGIYFLRFGGRSTSAAIMQGAGVEYFSFANRKTVQLFRFPKAVFYPRPDFCISPKEDRIVLGQVDVENIDLMLIDNFQ